MEERMLLSTRTFAVLCAAAFFAGRAGGQAKLDMRGISSVSAVTGQELALSKELMEALKEFHPQTDNMGNVWVTFGSGAPHRLIATPIDEPGYVVSEITADGYLRVQRLPQAAPNAVFDTLNFAQPVVVITREGKEVRGVFAGLSVHLQPGRLNPPKMNHVEELYLDIGANSAQEVRAAGVDLLDPVTMWRSDAVVHDAAAVGIGAAERAERQALLGLARGINESKAAGTTTLAFITQQWIGGRGLNRLLTEMTPDEMVYVGRVSPAPAEGQDSKAFEIFPRKGIVLGALADSAGGTETLPDKLKTLAENEKITIQSIIAVPPRIAGYVKGASLPKQFVALGLPLLWPVTPAEIAPSEDTWAMEKLLKGYLKIAKPFGELGGGGLWGSERNDIEALTEAYGASGHEEAVRKVLVNRLPGWAQKKVTTDAAGNLVLHIGDEKRETKTPRIAFVAHMDEIGYQVKKIEEDGRLQVEVLGGGYPQYFLGHVVLVHQKDGTSVGGVLELPAGWDKAGFEFPSSARSMDEPAHVYVGTKSKEETEKLGIALGDFVTIPKQYRPLLGTRANARSFDDRVGCAALIAAVRVLGPDLRGRDVTFVWSTEEEVGLKGAAAFAEQAAKQGRVPDFVFAIDTVVSSDSPLESKRFGDAEIGKGFVVRAVDNSNNVPLQYVDRVVALAKENNIPVQYGVTGGGNDGAVFTRFGSVDVALGWPLRYSHSPAEVIDTQDLEALGKIVAVIAQQW
jgi:putative aminopeptidase